MNDATMPLPLVLPEPEISEQEVAELVAVLVDWKAARVAAEEGDRVRQDGWLTAAEIGAKLGISDRAVRKIASAACPAVVSFPGSPGYKLWALCTVEEIGHCIEAFESQGKDMIKRAVTYRQAYHRRYRTAPTSAAGTHA